MSDEQIAAGSGNIFSLFYNNQMVIGGEGRRKERIINHELSVSAIQHTLLMRLCRSGIHSPRLSPAIEIPLRSPLLGDWIGCHTGNGGKLSNRLCDCLTYLCVAAA